MLARAPEIRQPVFRRLAELQILGIGHLAGVQVKGGNADFVRETVVSAALLAHHEGSGRDEYHARLVNRSFCLGRERRRKQDDREENYREPHAALLKTVPYSPAMAVPTATPIPGKTSDSLRRRTPKRFGQHALKT